MNLTNVTMDDGKKCAQLLNLLHAGKWDLSGADIAAHSDTVRWLHGLANQMAEQLKLSKATPTTPAVTVDSLTAPTTQAFRIKQMGPIGSGKISKKKK